MIMGLKRVLITGASGFIGKNLVLHYSSQEGMDLVHLLHRGPFPPRLQAIIESKSFFKQDTLDILDYEALRESSLDYDLIIHLAALSDIPTSIKEPRKSFKVNCEGFINICEIARLSSQEPLLLAFSSASVYGKPEYLPINEHHPLNGNTPYAIQKSMVEDISKCYLEMYGLSIIMIRPFNLYGPFQDERFLIATIINQALASSDIMLGNPYPVRNFTFIDDFIEAILLLVDARDQAVGEIFNVGNDEGISVKMLAEKIIQLIGHDLQLSFKKERFRKSKIEINKLTCDAQKIKSLTGWIPRHTLEQGLLKTIEYYQGS
ncbi:NAD-dependent epimerase/dehydratase family protein [Candidatus Bathyarchaeota archaeon]|nr:NAD-dependent epimerase/dehydratase family protein [Candidatus Bathyarchaeota archaeon]